MKILHLDYEIEDRILQVANKISKDYEGKELVLLGVLNGCFMFYSDLVKSMSGDVIIDFCKIKSYRGDKRGRLEFEKRWSGDLSNKHILIVEDIVDSGETVRFLLKEIEGERPLSVKVCTLCLKPQKDLKIDYFVFNMNESDYLYGRGMDKSEKLRHLPHIMID